METRAIGDSPIMKFISLFADFIHDIINQLDGVPIIQLGSAELVSLWDLIVGFIIMGFTISVFWKGART